MIPLLHERRQGDRREPGLSDTPVEALAADLAEGIARGEVEILFQPQVRIADGRVTAAEALARWEHPRAGALGADLLFAAAERGGLEKALSAHIQARALAAAAGWPEHLGALSLAINVTAGDLAHADFAEALLERVAASGLSPSRLTVEVTETALIADLPAAAAQLDAVRASGVRTAIDDFGTGYASFAYLKALPLDRLKIDKSLVADVATSERGRAVVRGIVALAHALGLDVVGEGVETEGQRDALAAEGCESYQGFLCAGALDAAELAALVARSW